MNQFPWMAETLRLMTTEELRDCGVTVYEAPKVPKGKKVVNLMNGVVVDFGLEGEMPSTGSYAKYDELLACAQRFGVEFYEQNRILYPTVEELMETAEVEA